MPLLHLEPLPRRATKSDLIEFFRDRGGIDRRLVGRIELRGNRALIEVPAGWETRLAKTLDGAVFRDRRVRVWLAETSDSPRASGAVAPANEEHFARLARLLKLENAAEAERVLERGRRLSPAEAEQSGNSLLDLVITDEDTGLGGRYLIQLVKRKRGRLPWTRLNSGAPILLSPDGPKAGDGLRGVVLERRENSIRVALSGNPDDLADHDTWRLDLSHDEVASQRQRIALDRTRTARGERLAELRDILLGLRPPAMKPDQERDAIALNSGLNEAQQEAVRFALAARDVALIHGPPGTGKTTAVVELIRRAVRRGEKVLACAPSNMAVDNIFERLLAYGLRAVRLGHPARVLPELRAHTLDLLVDEHDDVRLARKLVKEALALFRQAARTTRAKPEPGARRQIREEARSLLADARRLEMQAAEEILNQADVLCATTTGLDSEILGPRRFDLAVVDEACQSTEPGSWIPLLRCERVVLAGDHRQLPPTVLSAEAVGQGFGKSLFERVVELYGPDVVRLLNVQYRMHEAIMDFPSIELYDGQLAADASVAGHLLKDLPGVAADPMTETPLEFVDTAGAGFDEEIEPDGESRLNRREAELVCRKVRTLLELGLPAADIALITPYAAQVRLLRSQLDVPGLEIDSVDGFQGREKEAVVISLVRSNVKGEIGFLGDIRRMNVAMTRARRKLLMVGDSATLSNHPFYTRMLEYFEGHGAYHTVWETDIDNGPPV